MNALRHAIWITTIATTWGNSIAQEAGNAHEVNPHALDNISEPYNYSFKELSQADEVIDLLNNEAALRLSLKIGKQENMKEITRHILQYYNETGLNVAVMQTDGTYKIKLERISNEQYNNAIQILETLDKNGFPPDDDYYNKKK